MLTIPDTLQVQALAAHTKVALLRTPARLLISAMLAGAYIGVGIVLMLSTAGPMLATGEGSAKLVAGVVFGAALTLVVFGGGELATSAMMILPQGVAMRSVALRNALVLVLVVFVCNLLGALLFATLIHLSGVIAPGSGAHDMLTDMLALKASAAPIELFTRGVLCNTLVCLAVWMASRVDQPGAKIALIFVAITAFISSGFEHVIANMTTYGIGLWLGDPNAALPFFAHNLLWVGLGNFVGGGLVVGLGYWVVGGRPVWNHPKVVGADVSLATK